MPGHPTHHRTIAVDGTDVFYREAGPADAPVVLLLHGFPTSSHQFRNLIPALAHQFRVVAPDLPGFGFSAAPDRSTFPYTFDHLAQVIGRFTEVLGLDRYALYVFDYGAPVGLRLAAAHPERVTALVSQNGNAYAEGLSEGWNPIRAYWSDPSADNREALRAFLTPETTRWQYTHGAPDAALVAPEAPALDSALLARLGNDDIQLDLFLDYASNVALYPAFQAYLRTHQPPLLAIWGRNDPFFLPAGAEAFRRDVPDAEVRFVEGGHFPLETHGAEIAGTINAFLGRVLLNNAQPDGTGTPREVVGSFYAALNGGDVAGLLALLAPDVAWTEAERFPYYSGTWIGPQAVVDNLLHPLGRDWDGFSARSRDAVAEGERVVALGTYAGTFKATGRAMTAEFAHLWTVRDGLIRSFDMYTDTAKVLEATRG